MLIWVKPGHAYPNEFLSKNPLRPTIICLSKFCGAPAADAILKDRVTGCTGETSSPRSQSSPSCWQSFCSLCALWLREGEAGVTCGIMRDAWLTLGFKEVTSILLSSAGWWPFHFRSRWSSWNNYRLLSLAVRVPHDIRKWTKLSVIIKYIVTVNFTV